MYAEVLSAMAEHLGVELERIETDHKVFAASEDLSVAAGPIPRGGVSHVNWRWRGIVDGARKLTMSIHWYMETAHLEATDPPLWRIHIQGQPGVRLSVDLEKRPHDATATSAEQLGVAGAVINAIPLVCAAPAGVMTRPVATPFRGDWTREGLLHAATR
jgi:hypothetical protein